MLRRTLTILTPTFFALSVLLLPASQVHADDNVYSGLECQYQQADSFANEGQEMKDGDVVYDKIHGIGNLASDTYGTNPAEENYSMRVTCPLPPLDRDTQYVVVSVVDSTRNDDVSCQIFSCTPGIGGGETGIGLGSCRGGGLVATRHSNNPADGYTNSASGPEADMGNPEAGPGAAHVTQNADFLTFNRLNDNGMRNNRLPERPEVGAGALRHPFVSIHSSPGTLPDHTTYVLECTIPERSTALATSTTEGISYIQSYSVLDMDDME